MRRKQDRLEPRQMRRPSRGRLLLPLLLLGAMSWLVACGDTAPTASVVSVEIEQPDQTIAVGDTVPLSAKVTVLGGASTAVTWSSSDADVATVSASGVVEGVSDGVATITATSVGSPTRTDTVQVTVSSGAIIRSFTADPATIEAPASSTLTWQVTGDYEEITLLVGAAVVDSDLPAEGTRTVSPSITTVYTLRVSHEHGAPVTASATVTVSNATTDPVIGSFGGQVVSGSQAELTWTVANTDEVELFAVNPTDETDDLSLGTFPGSSTGTTVPLPDSDHQQFRLVARGGGMQVTEDLAPLPNVVLNALDYDVYNLRGAVPEPSVPGSLRSVLLSAPSGAVIGFASDVSTIVVYGVDLFAISGEGVVDSHLIARKNVTISGPADTRVTLEGRSAWKPGGAGDPYTYGSRTFYVPPSRTVTLENLVITGGTFIYKGSGVYNRGNLTIRNSIITDNRAFGTGGGIHNNAEGTLTVVNSEISDNDAVTLDTEIDHPWDIRGAGGDPAVFPGVNGWGGGLYNAGTATLTDTSVNGNRARQGGGGIYSIGTLAITNVTVDGNRADHYTGFIVGDTQDFSPGGGIANYGQLDATGGQISNNVAAEQGGGLFHAAVATATLTNVNITDNTAGVAPSVGFGGGIMHRFFTGEKDDNLTRTGGSLTGNLPRDEDESDDGVRPAGVTSGGLAVPSMLPAGVTFEGNKFD